MHICVAASFIGSDKTNLTSWHKTIAGTNADAMSTRRLETTLGEILI